MPRVSVLMAVHNGRRFLSPALDSVLAQEFSDYELVVVDDGSTDESPAILARYATANPAVRVLRRERNLGQTHALNIGLRHARGEYVARLDADDLCHPGRLGRQVALLDQHPEVGLLGSAVEVIDANDTPLRVLPAPQGHDLLYARLMLYNTFFHSAVMFRRELALRAGGYDENLRLAQDYDLWLRLAARARLESLPAPLIRWRQWESVSSTRSVQQQEAGREICLRHLLSRLAPAPLATGPFRRFWWAYHRDEPGCLQAGDLAALAPLWDFLAGLPAGEEAHGAGFAAFALKLLRVADYDNGRTMLRVCRRLGRPASLAAAIAAALKGAFRPPRRADPGAEDGA